MLLIADGIFELFIHHKLAISWKVSLVINASHNDLISTSFHLRDYSTFPSDKFYIYFMFISIKMSTKREFSDQQRATAPLQV